MFLSYVSVVISGEQIFDNSAGTGARGVNEAKGYLYIDPDNDRLCIKAESVWVELNPELVAEAWRRQKAK